MLSVNVPHMAVQAAFDIAWWRKPNPCQDDDQRSFAGGLWGSLCLRPGTGEAGGVCATYLQVVWVGDPQGVM